MANTTLGKAKSNKNDEFYTVYEYIQKEMNAYLEYNSDVFRDKVVLLPCDDPEWSNFTKYFAQNFNTLGLKKLISTCYAKNCPNGKILTITRAANERVDINAFMWQHLEGDGDFRSNEVRALRDEADIIVTNPPFSLFREFIIWATEADKKLIVIGNLNAITYKNVFPLIKDNKLWLGATNSTSGEIVFELPEGALILPKYKARAEQLGYKGNFIRVTHACWFTNIDHGKRHQPLSLMTMNDNLKFSKHKSVREYGYLKYDNYDAIEVPYVDAIPSDYTADMGVPISFLFKYCPEQFEIIGEANHGLDNDYDLFKPTIHSKDVFKRILIRSISKE